MRNLVSPLNIVLMVFTFGFVGDSVCIGKSAMGKEMASNKL